MSTEPIKITKEGKLSLRPYQTEAVNAFYDKVEQGQLSGIISAPTGSGKSVIIAEITRKYASEGKTVLIITHRKELIEQDDALFRKHCPNVKTGIISAMIGRKEFNRQITFSGIMTIIRNLNKLPKTDLIIIDEAHRVNFEKDTSYAKTINYLKSINPNLVILGLSATPYRMGQGLLYEGEHRIFDCLYYDIDIGSLVEQGYLCEVVARGSTMDIDLSHVHIKMGEYDSKELEKVANNAELTRHAIKEIRKFSYQRNSWVIFCCGVQHANDVKKALQNVGISAEVITGKTPVDEREQIVKDFKNGKITCIVNVGVLTEGFDYNGITMVVLLVSTNSVNKYIQMVGRGMRIAEGKKDCLLLDFGHNVERLGLITDVIPPEATKERKGKRSNVKKCPKCQTYVRINASRCPNCGHEFVSLGRPINHSATSYEGRLMDLKHRIDDKEGWHVVLSASYTIHCKNPDKPRTYRCMYKLDNGEIASRFLSLDKGANDFARRKSREYVKLVGGTAETIEEAQIQSDLWKIPSEVFLKKNGIFYDIEKIKIKKE